MNRQRAGTVAFVLALVGVAGAANAVGDVFSTIGFHEAGRQAAEQNKFVLVEAGTTWSRDGKRMKQTTWNDAELLSWVRDNAVAIRIDAGTDAPWALAHRVARFPTILLFSPEGAELARIAGFTEADKLLAELDKAATLYRERPTATRPVTPPAERDPLARHLAARRLADRGEHEAALEEYLWCLDRGPRVDPDYTTIRNSLLIRQIVELGQKYPPALDALRQRRDAAAARIRDGKEQAGDVATFASINRQLGEENNTLAVYDRLLTEPANPDTLRQLARLCFNPLLVQRRYRDIQLGNPDLFDQAMRQFDYYKESGALAGHYPNLTTQQFRDSRLAALREKVAQHYEVLLGIRATDKAAELAEKLIEIDPSAETYLSLARHALRSERPRRQDAQYARRADEARSGRDAGALAVLAELMAMTGQVDRAVTLLQKRIPAFDGETAESLRRLLHEMPKYAVYSPAVPATKPAEPGSGAP